MKRLKILLLLTIPCLFFLACSYPMRTISGTSLNHHPKEILSTGKKTGEELRKTDVKTTVDETTEKTQQKKKENIGNGKVDKKVKNHEQETMDEALDLLGESQDFWEKGDLESALKSLDKAYDLILDVNGNLDISRQKDDLRFMISKRILEIYASRYTVVTGNGSEIPLILNEAVKKEIQRYSTSDRNFFIRSYRRSGLYRPIILKYLKEAGLPEELSWLPLVESGFKIKALSSARALGLWQFIPSTGYKFGLKRDRFVDERMDVEKSTEAAIAYLKELHGMFGDWTTVLAAYNCGEGRVLRVISRQHVNYLDDFWDLYRRLPYETARYVPRFLATLHIIKDPDKYGMDLSNNLEDPFTYETVETNRCMRLRDIALYLNVPVKTLKSLNPELRYEITPDREYALKVPPGVGERFVLIAGKIPKARAPSPAFVIHRVKRGEALSVIAEKYKSSVRAIMAYNNLKSSNRIRAGQLLKIPMRGYGYFQPATKKRVRVSKILLTGKIIEYRVKHGDSLWSLARYFNTTVSEIKRINNLRSTKLGIDQLLRIKSRVAERTYTVQKGDNLAVIAKQEGASLNSILKLNGLSRNSRIYPGQVIIVKR